MESVESLRLHSGNSCLLGTGHSNCLSLGPLFEGLTRLHFCYRRNLHCKNLRVRSVLLFNNIFLSHMVYILLKSFYQFHYYKYQQDISLFHNKLIEFSSSQMIDSSDLKDTLTY
jgi:hypothetical protein